MGKIIAVRVRGRVGVEKSVVRTLNMLKLKRKFSCVILEDNQNLMGMINKVKDYISFGALNEETLKALLLKRAKIGKKNLQIDEKKLDSFVKDFMKNKKELESLKINSCFALHPPRGGFKKPVKKPAPKGFLGKNEKINELILRML